MLSFVIHWIWVGSPSNKARNETRGTRCFLKPNRCGVVPICLSEVAACDSEKAEVHEDEDEDEDNICR